MTRGAALRRGRWCGASAEPGKEARRMSEQGPQRSDQDNRWARHSKTLALWFLIVLMSILAIQLVRGQDETRAEFTYTEFVQQLEGGTSTV